MKVLLGILGPCKKFQFAIRTAIAKKKVYPKTLGHHRPIIDS